uniref:Uncharacterized protein n=1 Tax=mine drainage metagenome TaxID=410659 RepID=E6PSQ6_9ZZZZ
MSARPNLTVMAGALPDRARLALAIARSHDQDCDAATAFLLFAARPGASIDRLQKAIRSQTRRERGQRVFMPPCQAPPKSDRLLTADLRRTDAQPEPHHLEDPAALAELFEFIEALAADPTARRRLALVDQQDELARRRAVLAAKALGLTVRRAQQLKRLALASESPGEAWADAIRARARRETTKARHKKAMRARARLYRGEAPTQLGLFKRGGRSHG